MALVWECAHCTFQHTGALSALLACSLCGHVRQHVVQPPLHVVYTPTGPDSPSINQWLEEHKPTNYSSSGVDACESIVVFNPQYTPSTTHDDAGNKELVQHITETILTPLLKIKRKSPDVKDKAILDILTVARDNQYVSGKWLLFCPPKDVDRIWALIALATYENKLGMSAKVTPAKDRTTGSFRRDDILICVHVTNFDDTKKVQHCLSHLLELKEQNKEVTMRVTAFKPNIFSLLGLLSNNVYNLPVSMPMGKEMLQNARAVVVVDDIVAAFIKKRKERCGGGCGGCGGVCGIGSGDGGGGGGSSSSSSSSSSNANGPAKKKTKTKTLDSFFSKEEKKTPPQPAPTALVVGRNDAENIVSHLQTLYKLYDYDFDRLMKDIVPYCKGGSKSGT